VDEMNEDEIADLREWEVEMFDYLNRRLVTCADPARRNHPSCSGRSEELRELIEAADAFRPTRWW
jgi:hypothetical protein